MALCVYDAEPAYAPMQALCKMDSSSHQKLSYQTILAIRILVVVRVIRDLREFNEFLEEIVRVIRDFREFNELREEIVVERWKEWL